MNKTEMSRDLILDTDTVSAIRKEEIKLSQAKSIDCNYHLPVTQKLEFLDGIDDLSDDLRDSIQRVLEELNPEIIDLNSAPYGKAPYGHGPYGKLTDNFKELLDKMNYLEKDKNNVWDALGAETAISRNMEFVTRDETLQKALRDYSEEHLLCYRDYKLLVKEYSNQCS